MQGGLQAEITEEEAEQILYYRVIHLIHAVQDVRHRVWDLNMHLSTFIFDKEQVAQQYDERLRGRFEAEQAARRWLWVLERQ